MRQLGLHQWEVVALEVVAQQHLATVSETIERGGDCRSFGAGRGAAEGFRAVGSDGADRKNLVILLRMGFNIDGNNSTLGGDASSTCAQGVEYWRFQ